MNIDAQDAQDNQDGRLLQETLTRAMIACGFEDVREHKPAVSGKNPVHPVHRCESKIYPCLTMNRFPATRRKRLFQVSSAPALPCGSFEGETGFVSDKLSIPFQPLFFQSVETVLRQSGPSSFLVGPFVDNSFFFCFRQVGPPPCRADHTRVKQSEIDNPS